MEPLGVGVFYREDMDWYHGRKSPSSYYHSEEHDNSQDSGTASTTVCSSTSSSPATVMLTPGSNIPPPPRAQPPVPQHPPLNLNHHPLHPQRFDHPSSYPRHPAHITQQQENSYAEIPYGSLPVNNFDAYDHNNHQQKFDSRGKSDWKNGALVNIALGPEYPQPSGRPAPVTGGPTLVHLRDGPDGLLRVGPLERSAMDQPSTNSTAGGATTGTTTPSEKKRPKRRTRNTLIHVIVMALAGIAYIGLGALAGYHFGKSACGGSCADRPVVSLGSFSDDVITSSNLPENVTDGYGALDGAEPTTSGDVITPRVTSTTVTPSTVTTTPPEPVYCSKAGLECACGPFGGTGGRPFSDGDHYRRLGNITGFTVRHNDYFISGLQVTYGGQPGDEHGYTDSGYTVQVKLLRGEHVRSVEVAFTGGRGYLARLTVHTDRRILGPYGGPAQNTYSVSGRRLLFIDGRAGPLIDKLSFYFDHCT